MAVPKMALLALISTSFGALASAQGIDVLLQVGFLTESDAGKCESSDLGSVPTLSTNTVPQSFTCFNVSNIFSQNQESGFQNDTGGSPNSESMTNYDPRGVEWHIQNLDEYDSKANYSRIWHSQENSTADRPQPDEDSPFVLTAYAFENCKKAASDDDAEGEDFRWYESSCQTGSNGGCHAAPYSVKSFGIERRNGDCKVWATHDDATQEDAAQKVEGLSKLGLLAATMITCLVTNR